MKKLVNGILAAVILLPTFLSGQNVRSGIIGVSIDMSSTGNGHASFYVPSLSHTSGRSTISFGPIIQKRTMESNGFRLGYTFNLSGDPADLNYDLLQINAFGYAQYNKPLTLSYWAQTIENGIHSEPQIDWSKKRFSTMEATLGFELRLNITTKLTWKNYIGISYYNHITGFDGLRRTEHEKKGLTLCLGTGLQFIFPDLKKFTGAWQSHRETIRKNQTE